jgi:hypothetical protein
MSGIIYYCTLTTSYVITNFEVIWDFFPILLQYLHMYISVLIHIQFYLSCIEFI